MPGGRVLRYGSLGPQKNNHKITHYQGVGAWEEAYTFIFISPQSPPVAADVVSVK
jgi:hypothetical protein